MELKTLNVKHVMFFVFSAGILHLANSKCSIPGSPFKKFETSGTIQSRGYPDRYYENEECDWEINPPMGMTSELLVVRIIRVETSADDRCTSPNYVDIGPVRVCGNESSICIAYMLASSTHTLCHGKADEAFPECQKHLFIEWPFKVSFRTAEPDNKAGFKLEYIAVDCKDASTTPQNDAENTELTTARNKMIQPEGHVTTIPVTQKTKPLQNTKKTGTHEKSNLNNTRLILTVTVVILGVVFIAVILAVVFRKQIRAWAAGKKAGSEAGSSSSGDACVVSIDGSMKNERRIADAQEPNAPTDQTVESRNANGDLNQSKTSNGHANGGFH